MATANGRFGSLLPGTLHALPRGAIGLESVKQGISDTTPDVVMVIT